MKKATVSTLISLAGGLVLVLPMMLQFEPESSVNIPSFEKEVFPIIKTKCNLKDCHDVQRSNPIFTTYDGIKPQAKRILRRVKDRSIPMPPRESGITMTKDEISILEAWVNAGAPKN